MLYTLLFSLASVITYYISPTAVTGDGSYDNPYPFNWDENIKQVKRIGGGNDFILIFLEGDYFPPAGYGISITNKNSGSFGSISLKPEDGKKVRFICGTKLTNWTKSSISDKLWIHHINPEVNINSLFINDQRAILSRAPSSTKYARTKKYIESVDNEDENYLIRSFEVQEDCIEMLKLLDEEQLLNVNFVDLHYWTYSREKIIMLDSSNNVIKTRVSVAENNRFGVGKVRSGDFYYLENILSGLNMPGEYFVFPNNTIIYYQRENEDMTNIEAFIPYGSIGIHSTVRENITISNLEIMLASSGFYLTSQENLYIQNCTSKHCDQGMFIANSNNVTVERCLIEDIGGYGLNVRNNNYLIINNNIIRGYGQKEHNCHGMWVYETSNNTVISSNDISDGFHAPIEIFHKYNKDGATFNDIVVIDNHCHHAGYGLLDDMAGIVALFVAPGTVINHNHCHDIYSPGYCGGGFLTGSGSMNITFINNIAYDTSHNALKFDHGANIHVENNIFGFNDQAVLIWTSNTQGYHQWDILNNIFVFDSTIMMGAFDDSSADSLIDKNIYWHTLGPENINFRKTTWEYWRETRGYDHNSYIIDPLFVDHNNRNFNFINDSSYSLIDFKPFSLDFGVYGEKWWIDSANNYQYFDYHLAEKWQLESGYENFETNGNSYFWKQVVIDEQSSEIGITSENSCNGKKSLKFGITSSQNTNPTISIPANWYEGHSTFSLDIYMNNESSMYISLQQYNVIYLQKGKMKFINTEYINLPNKEWFNIKIKMNFGTVKESTKFDCQISGNDFNQTFNIYYRQDFSSITNIIIGVSESTDNIYIDNIHANIDQKHYQFFSQELEETNKLSSLFSNSGKSKISPGGIAGIVIGVIVIVIIAVIVVIFFIKRKNSNENSNDFHVHV